MSNTVRSIQLYTFRSEELPPWMANRSKDTANMLAAPPEKYVSRKVLMAIGRTTLGRWFIAWYKLLIASGK
ncbi:hypothetical protein K0M31_007825 [Melipona bicolor]|uniref:Uncharacterized protein n=1 Tax=Melipona bicolor TaxID=60889 RepID=A0AA40GC43_9HYME|nr:hypothetical protein K0M31_007825 [Melipona bicolor]